MGKTSEWTKFATKFYKEQKAKNPDYKFSDALKGAAKLYKGGAGDLQPTTLGGGEGEKGPMAGGRRKSRRRRSTGKRRRSSSRRRRRSHRR